jgi:hypothetical protein
MISTACSDYREEFDLYRAKYCKLYNEIAMPALEIEDYNDFFAYFKTDIVQEKITELERIAIRIREIIAENNLIDPLGPDHYSGFHRMIPIWVLGRFDTTLDYIQDLSQEAEQFKWMLKNNVESNNWFLRWLENPWEVKEEMRREGRARKFSKSPIMCGGTRNIRAISFS